VGATYPLGATKDPREVPCFVAGRPLAHYADRPPPSTPHLHPQHYARPARLTIKSPNSALRFAAQFNWTLSIMPRLPDAHPGPFALLHDG